MCGGIWWCLDHIWWCLVVSGACLVVSGARLVMLMDIDWYGLIWCIWADIFSNAHNRCADADALMLLMHWCYWSNDAAKGIALSTEFRTVVQRLVFFWIDRLTRSLNLPFRCLDDFNDDDLLVSFRRISSTCVGDSNSWRRNCQVVDCRPGGHLHYGWSSSL